MHPPRRTAATIVLACLSTIQAVPVSAQDDDEALLRLNHALFQTLMIERDPAFLIGNSSAEYLVVGPGGVVESREQVIAGMDAFAQLDSITVSRERIRRAHELAVVTNRLEMHGTLDLPIGAVGAVTVATTFVWIDHRWVAVLRTLTPCHPRADERGLC